MANRIISQWKGYSHLTREAIVAGCIVIFYLVGAIGHAYEVLLPIMITITPVFLSIFGVIAIVPALLQQQLSFYLWAAVTFAVTFTLEAVGTATGAIFGPYTYGNVLGPQLFDVPLLIAFNWLLVIIGAALLVKRFVKVPVLSALITGVIAAGFDFIMEPTAIALSYWQWETVKIPLQNYGAWFLIAFAAALPLDFIELKTKSLLPSFYMIIQAMYFFILRLVPPGSIG